MTNGRDLCNSNRRVTRFLSIAVETLPAWTENDKRHDEWEMIRIPRFYRKEIGYTSYKYLLPIVKKKEE